MEFSSPIYLIQLFNQFLNTKYIGSVLCCVLGIQGKEKERSPSSTEERNTIIIVTNMRYKLSALKIERGDSFNLKASQVFELGLSLEVESLVLRSPATICKMLCTHGIKHA